MSGEDFVMLKRLAVIMTLAIAFSFVLAVRIVMISSDSEVIEAASTNGHYILREKSEYASILDRNGKRLNNRGTKYIAMLDPHNANSLSVLKYAVDKDAFEKGMSGNLPFFCEVISENIRNVTVYRRTVRTASDQPARHIVGYTSDGRGVCGLELAFDEFLRSNYTENRAEFSIDATGSVLVGLENEKIIPKSIDSGILTTLDIDIQLICENAFRNSGYTKGAVIVMDISDGDIISCASFPEFDPENLSASLDSEDSPFINRAFSAYSVGSIFKLVTAAAALEAGISEDYSYNCVGSIDIDGQIFNCHKWGGHGEISMQDAMINSCNPYFIALSETISPDLLYKTAESFGFGKETVLADDMYSDSGYLPTVNELKVKAEKGNFSFGQGKLTATPLQICRLTCAIANNGVMPDISLVKGIRTDGNDEIYLKGKGERVISLLTSLKLKRYMCGVVVADNSQTFSEMIDSAGKTSTAQTGRFDENGNEIMNCWFTGYFPSVSPKYAVTILVEGGVSGNVSCGPIFKEIAENTIALEK